MKEELKKRSYEINDKLYIIPISPEKIGLLYITENQGEQIIELSENDVKEISKGIKAFTKCEHEWETVPDFDNGDFWFTPVKDICSKCKIDKPLLP